MKYEVLRPNYDKSILSISSSIKKNYNLKSNYKSLKELDDIFESNKRKNVIFMILDCMGVNILEKNLNKNDFLRKHMITSVTSVFPPTTAAATTSFHSGLSPYETGWIGWMPYFKEYDCMIELFSGRNYYTKEKVLESKSIMPYQTIYEFIEKNTNVKYAKLFPKHIDSNGYDTLNDLEEKLIKVTNNNSNNIISVYLEEPDHTIHHNGINGDETKKIVRQLNDFIEILCKKINDYTLIISADHGAVDIDEIYINNIPELVSCLKRPTSIESRFISFFVKTGRKREFKRQLDKYFHGKYLLYTKKQFLKENLLGLGSVHSNIDGYLGDYIFISKSEISLRYSDTKVDELLKADHAGITKDEMLVPVIVINSKK